MKRLLKIVLVTLVAGGACLAPARPGVAPSRDAAKRTIPTTHIYDHLFRYVLHLEKLRDPNAPNPFLTDFAQRVLGADATTLAALQAEAHAASADTDALDKQAHAIVMEIRARYPDRHVPARSRLPQMPESLKRLQHQRETVLAYHVAALHRKLGDPTFQALDGNVQKRFAHHIHSHRVNVGPADHNREQNPLLRIDQ